MERNASVLYCVICVIFAFIHGIAGVRRPDYMMQSEYHHRARVAMENEDSRRDETHANYGSSVRKVHDTDNHKMDSVRPSGAYTNPMTATKCCKLGERVAKEGMHCMFEIHTAPATLNSAHSAKLRLHRQHSLKSAGMEKSTSYKSLVSKVAKCQPFVSKFEKCCNYRTSFTRSMKRCRDLKGPERRQCRTKTRKSFGYTH